MNLDDVIRLLEHATDECWNFSVNDLVVKCGHGVEITMVELHGIPIAEVLTVAVERHQTVTELIPKRDGQNGVGGGIIEGL